MIWFNTSICEYQYGEWEWSRFECVSYCVFSLSCELKCDICQWRMLVLIYWHRMINRDRIENTIGWVGTKEEQLICLCWILNREM